jgi:hypothetical protein
MRIMLIIPASGFLNTLTTIICSINRPTHALQLKEIICLLVAPLDRY